MPFFDIFASPRWSPLRMRTKVASFFIFFQELSNKKKIKALRPKMTKIASRGGGVLPLVTWAVLALLSHLQSAFPVQILPLVSHNRMLQNKSILARSAWFWDAEYFLWLRSEQKNRPHRQQLQGHCTLRYSLHAFKLLTQSWCCVNVSGSCKNKQN